MSFLCFKSPGPGNLLPLRTPPYPPSLPPWRDANNQRGKQGRATETAVSRYHIGSTGTSGADANRHNCDGSGEGPLPSQYLPAPKVGRTTLPRRPCTGAEAAGMRWPSRCPWRWVRRGRPEARLGTGSALGVPGCGEGLSDSSPGSARLAETTCRRSRSQDLQAVGNGAALGHPVPLAWGNHSLLTHRPQEMAAVSPQRGQGLCLHPSLEMATPPPQFWKMSVPSPRPQGVTDLILRGPLG